MSESLVVVALNACGVRERLLDLRIFLVKYSSGGLIGRGGGPALSGGDGGVRPNEGLDSREDLSCIRPPPQDGHC